MPSTKIFPPSTAHYLGSASTASFVASCRLSTLDLLLPSTFVFSFSNLFICTWRQVCLSFCMCFFFFFLFSFTATNQFSLTTSHSTVFFLFFFSFSHSTQYLRPTYGVVCSSNLSNYLGWLYKFHEILLWNGIGRYRFDILRKNKRNCDFLILVVSWQIWYIPTALRFLYVGRPRNHKTSLRKVTVEEILRESYCWVKNRLTNCRLWEPIKSGLFDNPNKKPLAALLVSRDP